jgi:YggT family protein
VELFFSFIGILCEVLTFTIFIRVILSWFLTEPNTLTLILDKITEPILAPLRRIIPRAGMFDFTPMVAIIILQLIANLLP